LIGIELTGPLQLYFVASLVFGVAASLPIVAYEIYRFIDPALYPHERRTIYPFMGSFITLFIIGILFGYFFVARFLITAMFPFFGVVGAEQVISVVDFYNIVFITTLMTGVIFTTPALFVLLVKFGILSTTIVTKNRRYVYAGLFILAAFLTPDGGPIGDLILYIPMIILLEAGVYFAKRYEKRGDIQRAAWLPQRKECRFCGNEISDEATFCPRCGKSQL
jgi:sec-independent protein translocase protein TatC